MTEEQKYYSDFLRTAGVGLFVGGFISFITDKADFLPSMFLVVMGLTLVEEGYYIIRRSRR